MGNSPPPQNDSLYYAHGGWEYQEHEMGCFPGSQNGPYFDDFDHYSSCAWEDQNQRDFTHSYPIHQEPSPLNYTTSPPSFTCLNSSSFEYASAQKSIPNPYNSFHHPQNSIHYPQESYHFQNTQPQNNQFHLQTKPAQTLQPTQPPLDRLARMELFMEELKRSREEERLIRIELLLEEIIKTIEEEKIAKKDHDKKLRQNAQLYSEEQFIEELRSQRETTSLSPETEEFIQRSRKREEVNQGSPHSNETESCIEGEFIEPPIQEVLDEEDAPTIIQHPSPEIKVVKAINMSTKKRMVTKKRRTISMKKKRSTKSHPTPTPTSKFTQANNKRKLAGERHSKQGALTGSSFLLRSFLLTNWKKRKKVMNNMSS